MIQVYTGNGKGKTTAVLGLALRAAGAGLKVYIAQFLKGKKCSEHNALKKIKNIKIEQFGRGCFVKKVYGKEDLELTKKGLKKTERILSEKAYDVVILDEINIALDFGLLELKEVISLIKNTPKKTELILTGRHAKEEILRIADLVSEIKEVKHPYYKGVRARRGIEL
ncbi:MAG: cob(I)yrinic acid a,c-diamide adenosyltransferase [Candidatus Omnitrophota bacterium]|nr:cob(I)yrinic acid a,c-diamide adenosyltransferase [Candidatus Omnitrophota bacterium]